MALTLFLIKVSQLNITSTKVDDKGENDDESATNAPKTVFIDEENLTLLTAKVIFRGNY